MRVIRTKQEIALRKKLHHQLMKVGRDVLSGMGDTERRIQSILGASYWITKPEMLSGHTSSSRKMLWTAAWLHPAGSALMYLHYRSVSKLRRISIRHGGFYRWASRLATTSTVLMDDIYGGRYSALFVRADWDGCGYPPVIGSNGESQSVCAFGVGMADASILREPIKRGIALGESNPHSIYLKMSTKVRR